MPQITIKDANNVNQVVAATANTGQTTASESLPVVIASDQPNINVTSSNITNKFREAFEVDPSTSGKWSVSTSTGDIITVDGNAVASSYAVISLNPLTSGTQSLIESLDKFSLPVELAIGASMSQRTVGQEFSLELVSDETPLPTPSDLAIASISQATTTLTVTTTLPHNLRAGMSVGIFGCVDSRLNYPSLVIASTPTTNQFTCTSIPGAALPSVTAGPFTSGNVYQRSRLGFAKNGTNIMFESASATAASFYVRSESGDVLPSGTLTGSHPIAIATTASVQAINSIGTYAFQPTSEYRLAAQADRLQWYDVGVDQIGQATNRRNVTQVIPSPSQNYEFRVRAVNNKGLTVPVAQIVLSLIHI